MHDFLEGVGPYEVKLVLQHLCEVIHCFTLEQLNTRIANYPYGATDAKKTGHLQFSVLMLMNHMP